MSNRIKQRKEYLRGTVHTAFSIYKNFLPEDIDSVMLAKMCLTMIEAADCLAEEDEEFARVWNERSALKVSEPNSPKTNLIEISNTIEHINTKPIKDRMFKSKQLKGKHKGTFIEAIADNTDMSYAYVSGTNTISCTCDLCGSEMKAVRTELDTGDRTGMFGRFKVLEDTFICKNKLCTRHSKVTYTQRVEDTFATVYHYTIRGCRLYNKKVDERRPDIK